MVQKDWNLGIERCGIVVGKLPVLVVCSSWMSFEYIAEIWSGKRVDLGLAVQAKSGLSWAGLPQEIKHCGFQCRWSADMGLRVVRRLTPSDSVEVPSF